MLSDEEKILTKKLRYCEQEYEQDGYLSVGKFEAIKEAVNLIEKQSKEIEELKANHITTNNKATNTEKAKIFDVIENSIDTYIEKSKPYWEQIMTKDEMTIDEALTIIDDMYQDRYKIMSQKTEKETIVDLSKMDYIKFTNLEWASVRVLREVQSLRHEMEKQSKEIEQLKKYEKYYEEMEEVNKKFIAVDKIKEILEIEEKIDNEKLLSLLQTIVDENARLEDIEDRKVQIEYNNVFNKGVKSVEDKIKAKIEEVKDGTYDAKIVLESLLEKE